MNTLPQAFAEMGVRLDLLITGWSAVALFIIAAATFALAARSYRGWDDSAWIFPSFICGIVGLIVAAVWVVLLIPFDGKYHHYYEVSGHVDSVSNVLSEADGELTRQPVITLDSVDRPLVVNDPRAVSLKDADVTLRCTVDWNYQAADAYECRVVAFDSGAGA